MLNLLYKDFKLMFRQDKKLSKRIISAVFSIIFLGAFVAIEVFLFTTLISKTDKFKNASMTFMSLFLFIISILLIIAGVIRANKLFFNEKDIEQLSVHPVSNSSVIFSKLLFLFITHYATSIMFIYLVSYVLFFITARGIDGAGQIFFRYYLPMGIYSFILTPLWYYLIRAVYRKFSVDYTEY